MSIYIPGLNLPPKGGKRLALFIGSDGVVDAYRSVAEAIPHWESIVCETEAVELPPHGRLIDADANIKSLNACIEKPEDDIARECYKYAKALLNACPTIIPADPGGGADNA